MKKIIFLAVAALGFSGTAFAQSAADLAKAYGCLTCHSVQNKVIGPAFTEVAKRYAGDKSAEAKLVHRVLNGGSGAWGTVPKPPNPKLNEAQARTLVKWVLSLK